MQGTKPKAFSQLPISSYANSRKQANSTLTESFKEFITNIGFNIQGLAFPKYFRSQGQKQPEKQQSSCWLFGVKMNDNDFIAEHKKIIWFTYKNKLQINSRVHTDAGWGCLLRVTQMALAHALTRFFKLTQQRVDKNYIITPFLEEKGGEFKYSLYQLLQKGYHMWRLKPEDWYSMTQASTIIESLQNSNPLKGSQNLKVRVYNQVINVKEITQTMNLQYCTCQVKQVGCQICLLKNQGMQKKGYFKIKPTQNARKGMALTRFEKHLLIIVTTKLGDSKIGKQQFSSLLKIMQLPIFAGCLGGIPKKARFLTGCHQRKISYLDPHYVSNYVAPMKLEKNLEIFGCKEVRFTGKEELDPQMGICFYLSNEHDLALLLGEIDQMNQTLGGDFLRYEWGENDFEVLGEEKKKGNCTALKQHFQDLEQSFSDLNYSNADSSFIME